MLGLRFFSRAKPRSYSYKPRYYDPVKQEWEERKKQVRGSRPGSTASSAGENKQYVPGDMIRARQESRQAARENNNGWSKSRQKSIILLIIIVLLVLAGFYLYRF